MRVVRVIASSRLLIAASLCLSAVTDARATRTVTMRTDFGHVTVDPLDVKAAIEEGEAAQDSCRRVLLLPRVRFVIADVGSGRRPFASHSGRYVVYSWPFPNGSRRFAPRPPTSALRHEIGHDMLKRYLVRRSREDEYGTDAPDWLDEMAAIAFEGEEQQASRRRTARAASSGVGLIPLGRLLTMAHPELHSEETTSAGAGSGGSPPTSEDTIRFYATIRAFYDYLVATTGDEAVVAHLAAAYSHGVSLTDWLLSLPAMKNEGASLIEMDASFRKWFDRDPRYGR